MINQLQGLQDDNGELKTALHDLYHDSCCGLPNLSATPISEELLRLLTAMFKKVYKQMGMPTKVDAAVVKHFAEQYFSGIESTYGKTLVEIDYTSPDYVMLRNLRESCYQFSAAKNYQMLKQTTMALISEEGKLRSFNEFKNAAFDICNEQVTSWLQAEYNLAVAGGQMAATWQRANDNAAILPLLQFDATIDNRTSPICHSLNGIIKPINDTFWDIYYPPNHFNCRSDARSLATGKITPTTDIVFPDKVPDMFKTNLAKNGLAFPKDHPYFKGAPHQVSEQASKIANGK